MAYRAVLIMLAALVAAVDAALAANAGGPDVRWLHALKTVLAAAAEDARVPGDGEEYGWPYN